MKEPHGPWSEGANAPKHSFAKWATAIIALLARAWRIDRQSLMRALVVLGATIGIVTNCIGFVGLSSGHYGGWLIGIGLAIMVTAASAVCFGFALTSWTWPSRIGWIVVWMFCASITVGVEYGYWFFQGSGEQLTSRTARDAARNAAIPLTAFASDYRALSDQATGLREFSAAKAAEESAKGFTCDPAVGANPGPRQRLRDRDAATFAHYARAFDKEDAELRRTLGSLDAVYEAAGPSFFTTASSTIARAYAITAAAKQDPNLAAFRAFLRQRIVDGRAGVKDPQTGEVFKCPDQELESRMQAALAVQLSELPPMPPQIVEPTLTSAAARPFILLTHPSEFQPDLDVRPLLLGLLVDVLQCAFVAALLRNESNGDRKQARGAEGSQGAWLHEALGRRSTVFSQLQKLREGYAGDRSWLRFLDRYTITVPPTRPSEAALDFLVVPSAEDIRAFGARSLVLVLTGSSRATLLYFAPFEDLSPRWREKLGSGWSPETSFDVYQLNPGLLNELILAAANFETTNADAFWSSGSAREQAEGDPTDDPREMATQS